MQVYYGFEACPSLRRSAVAVGSFDGVHCGHRLLMDVLAEEAKAAGGESVVVTFEPHPRLVLKGENRLLTTLPEKLMLLAETPVRHVVVVPFTREFSQTPAEQFVRDDLAGKLGAAVVVEGEGHHFGHNRGGSEGLLERYGIRTVNLGRYHSISSTAVRTAIVQGDMPKAAELLGGPYLVLTAPPHDPTKLLPPPGDYEVLRDGLKARMRIDESLFSAPERVLRILSRIK